VFIGFKSKGIRSKRVIMLIEISIEEPKYAASALAYLVSKNESLKDLSRLTK
jgi:hypothetical protein